MDVTSGNMYHEFEDISIDYSGASLSFNRYYNSQSDYDGPLGYGWSHNYDYYLTNDYVIDGHPYTDTNKISIRMGGGKYIYFMRQADGSFRAIFWTKTTLALVSGYYVWTTEDGTVYRFSESNGRLTDITNRTGATLTLDYNEDGRLWKVTEPFGHFIEIAYDTDGRVHTVTDPAGRTYTYGYLDSYGDPDGNLDTVTYPDNASERYFYTDHNLMSVTDPNGNVSMHWDYDTADRCILSSGNGADNMITFEYNSGQTVLTKYIDGVSSSTTTYSYDTKDNVGGVTSISGPGCSECNGGGEFTYDPKDPYIITSSKDKNGNLTLYSNFDAKGNPGRVVDAAGTKDQRRTNYTYHLTTGAPTSISRRSAVAFGNYSTSRQVYSYDGTRLSKSYSKGYTRGVDYTSGTNPQFFNYSTSYSYNSHNQVKQVTDPAGHKAVFGYYSTVAGDPNHGQPSYVTNPLGGTVSFGNYSSGRPGWIRTARGEVTNFKYDYRGRILLAVSHDSGGTYTRTTRYGYNAFGNMTTATLPSGKRIGYTYYSNNRLWKVRDADGNYVSYTYDTEGNTTVAEAKDSTGTLKKYAAMTYDTENRLSARKTFGSYSTVNRYDAFGNMTSSRDFNGSVMTYAYDFLNRLKNIVLPDPGDDSGTVTSAYSYDIDDNRTGTVDGNTNRTSSVYDDMDRLVETTDAEGRVTRYGYDASGNLTAIKDPEGNVTTFAYTYNATTLVVTKTYPEDQNGHASTEVYTFDSSGLLVSKTNARGVTATYTYDDFGKLTGIGYDDSGVTPSVSYTYDQNLDRLATASSGGLTYQYSVYDSNARAITVVDPWDNEIHYTYDSLGRVHTIQVGSGETVTYEYDKDGRPDTVTAGTRTYTYSYTEGKAVPDSLERPNLSKSFYTYDNLYRLKDIANKTASGTVITANHFEYDKAHMKTSETATNGDMPGLEGSLVTYGYNAVNQLTSSSKDGNCTYDEDGKMLTWSAGGVSYTATYDAESRMTSVSYNDGSPHSTSFVYGPDGFVIKQVVDGTETRFVTSGGLVLQERDGSNNVTRSYVWDGVSPGGIGGLLELTQGGAHYDYLYDGKGNVRAVIDADGNVVASYAYDPFGVLVAVSGTLDQPYRFSTKRYYQNFWLNYFGYRFYMANLGRWINRDPIGEAGGVNLYGFVGNSPVNYVDPWGLSPADWANGIDSSIDAAHNFIEFDGGNIGVVLTNTVTGTLADIAHGTVDMLRFGEGIAEYDISGNQNALWDDVGRGSGIVLCVAGGGKASKVSNDTRLGTIERVMQRGNSGNLTVFRYNSPDGLQQFRLDYGKVPNLNQKLPHYHRRPGMSKHRPWEGGW